MHQAETTLSKLVADLEAGREDEVTIARSGRPVARLGRIDAGEPACPRIGIAEGVFTMPERSYELDQEVAELFVAEDQEER